MGLLVALCSLTIIGLIDMRAVCFFLKSKDLVVSTLFISFRTVVMRTEPIEQLENPPIGIVPNNWQLPITFYYLESKIKKELAKSLLPKELQMILTLGVISTHAASVMNAFSVIATVDPASQPFLRSSSSLIPAGRFFPFNTNAVGPLWPAGVPVRNMVMEQR